MFGIDEVFDEQALPDQDQGCDTAMEISCHALTGRASPRAFKLHAWIQGREVLMLADFGSSTSFLDKQLAATLVGVVPLV